MPRRSYGSGSLYEREDKGEAVSWYGHWRCDGQQIKRRIGAKSIPGSREGLTRKQAEAELRRLMAEVKSMPRAPGQALTIAELAHDYLAHLRYQKRKKATTTAVESIVRIWLEPYFSERDLRRITVAEVKELMGMMESGQRPGPRQKGDRRHGRKVGPKSVRNYIGTLSTLLGFAEREGLIAVGANVANKVQGRHRSASWATQGSVCLSSRGRR